MKKTEILSTELLDEILTSINLSEGEKMFWKHVRRRVRQGAIITLNSESVLKMMLDPKDAKRFPQ